MSRPNAHASSPHFRHLVTTLGALVLWLSQISPARADTEIVLNGKVTAGTCVVVADSVVWDDISAADIPAIKGRIAASAHRFNIEMSSCAGVRFAKLTFGQTSDQHPDQTDTFRNMSPLPAPHLSIWVQRASGVGTCPSSGSTQGPGSTYTLLVENDTATLPLCATYWNVDGGEVTAGEMYASVTVGIAYL